MVTWDFEQVLLSLTVEDYKCGFMYGMLLIDKQLKKLVEYN